MKNFLQTSVLLGLLCAPVIGMSQDGRIQTEIYNKDTVYVVFAKLGTANLIQLEEGETFDKTSNSAFGGGDLAAWEIGVRDNNIMIKPKEKLPTTNLILVTNKRTYAFDVKVAGEKDTVTYIKRFIYPDSIAAKATADLALAAEKATILTKAKTDKRTLNTEYYFRGSDVALLPSAAWDNGLFTYFKYPNAKELPLFYKRLPDGKEAIVNSHLEGDTVVIQELSSLFVVRLGEAVLEITNKKTNSGEFNTTGTSMNNSVRIDLQGKQQ
jgi:type IV secretion system protein VirB9